jgi:hypothetical protein
VQDSPDRSSFRGRLFRRFLIFVRR